MVAIKLLAVACLACHASAQLLRPAFMHLGVYNPETKHYEKTNIFGGDDHDLRPHSRPNLGGDDHDLRPHNRPNLGGDDHDLRPHRRQNLGGDDHDLRPHRRQNLGGDDHDLRPHHSKPLLGGDDHDLRPHRRQNLGGDDHDLRPHRRQNLGGDDHDLRPHHSKPLLGGDDHDLRPHRRQNLGGDDHDLKSHRRPNLGGDDHDLKPHRRQNLGGDDHDLKPHRVHLLEGGDHDLKPHIQSLEGENIHRNPHQRINPVLAFRDFMHTHKKSYFGEEFQQRFMIFQRNLHRIKQLQRSERGTATYGITKFADLTEDEFKKMLGFRPELRRPSENRTVVTSVEDVELPESFDWRDHNAVTPIKNQGMCGSCWAFSTTGNVEGQWAIKNKELVSLSEQELVDCDSEDHGCEGGLPENAYDAIMKLGGLETEEEYPYNGHDGQCHMEKSKARVNVSGSVELPEDEVQMAKWLLKNGPISVGINANPLQFYTGGVCHPFKFLCGASGIDHGVLIVGYGVHTTKYLHRRQPYWLVKNSWGTGWGEKGYFRMYRGDGTCGINKMATSARV